jgi:hypothetical protein
VLRRSWAFAIAADGSAHVQGVACFSIRLRLISIESKTRKSTLRNVHLVAPPMASSHTGQNMSEMTSCALDALGRKWRSRLIGCTSAGAANMTVVHSGANLWLKRRAKGKDPSSESIALLDMSPRSLQDSLVAMRSRLSLTLPSDFPHKVCSEYTGLKRDVNNSEDLKSKLEEAANRAGAADYFRACWEPLNGNCPHLQHFAGGLSTVFSGSSTVESDFSILTLGSLTTALPSRTHVLKGYSTRGNSRKSSSFKWNLRMGTLFSSCASEWNCW